MREENTSKHDQFRVKDEAGLALPLPCRLVVKLGSRPRQNQWNLIFLAKKSERNAFVAAKFGGET